MRVSSSMFGRRMPRLALADTCRPPPPAPLSPLGVVATFACVGTVGRRNEEQLATNFQNLKAQWPRWGWLRDRLRSAGLEPTSARKLATSDTRSSWVILAKPSDALQKHFELAPEVLVLCSPWEMIQANDIKRVEEVFREELRVDPGFALVITGDMGAEARLGPALPESRRYLFVRDETFHTTSDPQAFLHNLLREALGRRRLFDLRPPAGGWQFFGREKELEALERDVLTGHSLGVFGLRKVGKTSLLRRVAEKSRADGESRRVIPIEVDLLATSYLRRNFDGVVELIGRALDRETRTAQIRVPAPHSHPLERLRETVEHVEQGLHARVLLILDEYEALLGVRIPRNQGVDLLTWLRGLAQEHPRSFGLVLAGRNQMLIAPARIDGTDNPMYRFLRSVPVAGLAPEDCRRMVRKLGGRMGLRFEPDALDIFVQETGGHPALVRTLGDIVDTHVPTSKRNPFIVDAAVVRGVLPRFSRDVDEDMRELVAAANDFDPRAGAYLVHIAHAVPWIGGPSEARINDALAGYGSCTPTHTSFVSAASERGSGTTTKAPQRRLMVDGVENPYRTDHVADALFVGREALLAELCKAVKDGRNAVRAVMGGRGMGKSSLAGQIRVRLAPDA